MRLEGKRVLITGGARGLGAATIDALRELGAQVVGIDVERDDPQHNPSIIVADIRDEDATRAAVAAAIARLGGIDVLVNNAGVLGLEDAGAPPGTPAHDAVAVNLLGAWRVTAAALPALVESGGRVVNVSSLFAFVNAPYIPAYCATKRGLSAYSDALRFQYRGRISVVTVYPGYMRTPIHDLAERQGLSVERLVTFRLGGLEVFTLEEPLEVAARGLIKACASRSERDRGLTVLGGVALRTARFMPKLVDWFIGWRLRRSKTSVRLEPSASQPIT